MLILGLVMIPYPGPGWLVVFLGLGILATEYVWAHHLLARIKGYYELWQAWLAKQSFPVKTVFWLLTATVVVLTVWLLDGYGILDHWLHLGQPWLHSPLL